MGNREKKETEKSQPKFKLELPRSSVRPEDILNDLVDLDIKTRIEI